MNDEQKLNVLKAASFNLDVVVNQIESLGDDNPVKPLTKQLKSINAKLTDAMESLNG